ncbi:hypothetical protein NMY22_g17955 [Coprinellus aureogranulatus]|nr:hypothetical protein NMY22_g17955 [Coprinellus aureogranulatus]
MPLLLSSDVPPVDFFADACVLIKETRKGRCSSIDCPSKRDRDSVCARLCTKCDVARYCGTKCQTEAWMHKQFPHKAVCSKLLKLKEQLGLNDSKVHGLVQSQGRRRKGGARARISPSRGEEFPRLLSKWEPIAIPVTACSYGIILWHTSARVIGDPNPPAPAWSQRQRTPRQGRALECPWLDLKDHFNRQQLAGSATQYCLDGAFSQTMALLYLREVPFFTSRSFLRPQSSALSRSIAKFHLLARSASPALDHSPLLSFTVNLRPSVVEQSPNTMPNEQDAPLTLDMAVSYLTAAFTNPLNPNSCHLRMRCAVSCIYDALEPCTTNPAIRQALKPYPQLLRAGIKFLTRKQSAEAHASMVKQLCVCRCRCAPQEMGRLAELHMYAPSEEDVKMPKPLEANHHLIIVLQAIIMWLSSTLAAPTRGKFSGETGNSDGQSWPTSESDLLPYGCEDSVDGLNLWASEPNGHSIYAVAIQLAQFYPPFAKATFKPPSYDFAVKTLFKHLDSSMTVYDSDPSHPVLEVVVQIATIFLGFHLVTSSMSQANLIAMEPYKPMARSILARVWALCPSIDISPMMRCNVALLLDTMTMEMDPQTGRFLPGQEQASALHSARSFDVTDTYGDTCVLIIQALKGGCSNIDCPSKGTSVYARLCTKCQAVRYCGTKCQTEAWKHRHFPHKAICSKLHALKKQLGYKDWAQIRETESEDQAYRDAFTALCKAKSVDIDLVQELEYYLRGVRG